MKPIRFDGQVAVVTGAGRGLGRAYALLLGERGAHVVVHDAGVGPDGSGADPSVAEAVEEEIARRDGSAEASFEDLAVRGAGAELIERIHRRHGRLDVLIHSAGISSRADLAALDDRDLDRILAINGRAAIELVRAAFPRMSDGGYGRMVLTVSGHGLYPGDDADLVAYGVTKAMQFGLMNAVAGTFARAGVLVNAISPVAATRMMTRRVEPGTFRHEDVAPGVAYLASANCQASGVVLRAANGRFSVGRYAVSAGVDLRSIGSIEPEAVADAWPDITGDRLEAP